MPEAIERFSTDQDIANKQQESVRCVDAISTVLGWQVSRQDFAKSASLNQAIDDRQSTDGSGVENEISSRGLGCEGSRIRSPMSWFIIAFHAAMIGLNTVQKQRSAQKLLAP